MKQFVEAESHQISHIDEFVELNLIYAAYFWKNVDLPQLFYLSAWE